MPNRHGSTDDYRYGFQGQEKDDEIKGEGNSLNYKYRMHDPRVVRFFAVDPLAKKYPYYSPYSFGGNTPIMAAELEGLEIGKPAYDRAKNWLQEKKDAGSWGAGVGLGLLKTATLEGIGDQIKETVVTLVNNPPPPKPLKEALFFPAFEFYHMGEQVVDTAEKAVDGDGEAFVSLVTDIGGAFIGITEFRAAINTAKAEAKALKSQLKQTSNKFERGANIIKKTPDDIDFKQIMPGEEDWLAISDKATGADLGYITRSEFDVIEFDVIVPENMRKQGLLNSAIQKGVDRYNPSIVRGTWKKNFNNGDSVNYKSYKKNLATMKDAEKAALNTPTGKAAQKAGFNRAKVDTSANGEVISVDFYKG